MPNVESLTSFLEADSGASGQDLALTQAILNSIPAQIAVLDCHGVIVAVNHAWKTFGLENAAEPGSEVSGTCVGTNYFMACRSDTDNQAENEFAQQARVGIEAVMSGIQPRFDLEYPCHSPIKQLWFLMTATPLEGVINGGVVVIHTNITERKLAEIALRESEERLGFALEGSSIGAWDWNLQTGHATYSKLWKEMLGFGDEEIQSRAEEWKNRVCPDDLPEVMTKIQEHLDGMTETATIEFRMLAKDGSWKWILGRGKVVCWNADGVPVRMVGTNSDISYRKRQEEQERHFAFHDVLTKLPNRRLLYDRLNQMLVTNKRTDGYGALMFIDLDNFKPLNDAHGHLVGDLLLIEATRRLMSHVREADTVGRFGGDEFVVMLGALGNDMTKAVSGAEVVAEKIRVSLADPYLLPAPSEEVPSLTISHHCSASIGIVVFGGQDANQDEIFRRADLAMYKAKDAGRNAFWVSEWKPAVCS